MRRILRTPAVFMCLVLIPTASFAQASIAGMVRDASGGVLPGVTVEATSPALIEKARTVVTDAGGQYRIVDLRPGTYAVTFTLPGFSTFRREGIELAGSFTATVNAELRLGTIEESVTVTGESPLVDVQSASYQRVIDNEVAEAIPTARLHYSLAVLIPGVTLGSGLNTSGMGNQDVGGSTGDQVLKLQIHGGRAFEQRVLLNGLPVGRVDQPMGGVFTPNLSATEEVVVDTGGLSPDMAEGGIRMTIVPRDGGNTFAGVVFGSFGSEHLATSNLTDDLKARGLLQANSIKSNGEFNPGFGGPIQRDKLWFYVAGRYMFYDNYAAGMWVDSTKNDPNVWTFNPDLSRPASNHQNVQDAQVRLTWQASPKNKLAFSYLDGAQCKCPYALSATIVESLWVQWRLQQITSNWTAPLTNRLMLEAGLLGNLNERAGMGIPPDTNPLNIPLMEQSTGLVYKARAGLGGTGYNRNPTHKVYYRSGLTYITGAHAFKIGFSNGWGAKDEHAFVLNPQFPYSYRLNNGVPNRVNLFSQPYHSMWNLDADLVVYAQDKWTVDRLTLNGGLLYSYFKSHFPENRFVPTPLLPDRNFTIPKTPHLAWKDITPRIGAAYDLFGTGRTAVKASLNKYLYGEQLTAYFGDPVADVVASTFRAWNDGNGDFKPDCDLTNPGVNGECGAMANPNFGKSVLGRTFDPEVKFGWGKRPFNWEFSTGVQHQLLSGVSM